MNYFPPPGAFPSMRDEDEVNYRQLVQKRFRDIPARGGIDEVPLIIHHQKKLPSCTGEAGAYCQMINHYFNTGEVIDLSPMFIYKMNRLFDGLPPDAKGSTLKATMQSLQAKGVCQELLFPSTSENCYTPFPYNDPRAKHLFEDAKKHTVIDYARCETLEEMIMALSEGRVVIFSLFLYSSFYQAKEGWVPKKISGKKIGGHAMLAIGYDLEKQYVKVVQSWGDEPGGPTDGGYMYIPFNWFRQPLNAKLTLMIEGFIPLNYSARHRLEELARQEVAVEINSKVVPTGKLLRHITDEDSQLVVPLPVLRSILEDLVGESVLLHYDQHEKVLQIKI